MRVVAGNAVRGIDDEHDDVALFNRLQGLNNRELFDGFKNLALLSQARGIDEFKRASAVFEIHLHRVARGAGHVKRNDALFTQEGVDERGLADVGAPRHRHLDAFGSIGIFRFLGFRFFFGVRLRKILHHEVHEGVHPLAVRGGNADGIAQTQFMEFRDVQRLKPFGLIDRKVNGTFGRSQAPRNAFVVRRQPRAGIADENDDVGFCDGAFGLSRHFFDDAFALDGFKAPRVDDDVRTRPHPALTVLSVARQPREIRHDGVPAAGKAVKEGGLPHIGASDQSHNWQHRYSVYVVLLKSPTIIPGAPPSRYALRPSE